MATIYLTGLPSSCKLQKVVFLFKSILKPQGIMKFWIKEMSDIRGTDLKSANIEFNTIDDAHEALNILNGFKYNDGKRDFPLTACINGEDCRRPRRRSPSPFRYRSRERDVYDEPRYSSYSRYHGYERDRSRSPDSRETSKLDLEIELLRKQRMIIEEERRILLERKKLELVKEFGPSALREFHDMEEDRSRERDRDRGYRPERSEDYQPRRRRRSPIPPPPRISRPPPHKKDTGLLPQFLLPCKLIIRELNEYINKYGTKKENFLLVKLIRSTLRKRLAVALVGKPIMSAGKIVKLYRKLYPTSLDEEFVKKHLKDLRACHLHFKEDHEEAKKMQISGTSDEDKKVDNGVDEKVDPEMETANRDNDVANIETEPGEKCEPVPISSEDKPHMEETEEEREEEQTVRPCSETSEVALALHDKNDEDWIQGEHDWDDINPKVTQG